MDEFTVMMNEYIPTSTLGLRDLFNTFGKMNRKRFSKNKTKNAYRFKRRWCC